MPKITDPSILSQLNGGGGTVVSTMPGTGPRPPSGYQARPGGMGPVPGGPEDPSQAAALAAARAQAESAARTAGAIREAAAKAQIDLETERRKREQVPGALTPAQVAAQRSLANDEILGAIADARNRVNGGYSTGMSAQVLGRLGGTNATDLNGALDTIKGNLTLDNLQRLKAQSATGASGMGSLTEREGQLLASTVASLDQTQSKEVLLQSLAKIERHYRGYQALLAGEDPNKPDVAQRYGIVAAPHPVPPGSPPPGAGGTPPAGGVPGGDPNGPLTFATGGTRSVADATMKGANDHTRSMIMAGRPAAEIVAYLNQLRPGAGTENAANIAAQLQYRAQRPQAPASMYGVNVENMQIPMTAPRAILNAAAQSPVGAFGIGAGDAVTLGTLDNMTDNPALARAGMAGVRNAQPLASMAGTVVGGATMAGGVEAGLGRLGVRGGAGLLAPRALAADATYGAGYGAGSADDGSRLAGAAWGGLAGLGGGVTGRAAMRGVGNTLTGVRDVSAQYLRDAGVPMTPGQIVRNSGGLGRRLARREDRLAGLPGVGDRIQNQRLNGLRAFNGATFGEALEPIGVQGTGMVGENGVQAARGAVSAAYRRALGGTRVNIDPQFGTDLQGAVGQIAAIPRVGAEVADTVGQVVPPYFDAAGGLSGDNMQPMLQELRRFRNGYAGDPLGHRVGQGIRGVENSVTGMFERQAPHVIPAFDAANAAFRRTSIVGDATLAGMNTEGVFTPAQLGQAARRNAINYEGRLNAASDRRPFFDLQRAGQNVLPSKVPDSGTAGRIEAGGGMLGSARRAVRNAVHAPLYSDTLQPAIGAALLARNPGMIRAGDYLLDHSAYGGRVAVPLALQYYGFGAQ